MPIKNQTRASELRPYGITLIYLAGVAKRSVGYVKQWSAGYEKSGHLDKVAARLVRQRRIEQSEEA
jgi:hypothetical protein